MDDFRRIDRSLGGKAPISPERAAALAQEALLFIAEREDALGAFLGGAGLSVSELRDRAADPEFLGFALDFLLGDEALLLAFAETAQISPELPMRARAALPGGDAPHWT